MTAQLDNFLAQQGSYVEETEVWGGGSLPLRVRSYLCGDLPPIDLVTTVRALVCQDATVLVVQDVSGKVHLTPGGRRESGETLEETLRREVLEETGWTLQGVKLLGFMHFHHLAPKPEGYRYAYPDFLQLIYAGEASEYREEAREAGGYEIGANFQAIEQVSLLPLSASQNMFLNAELQRRSHSGNT